MLIIKMIQYVLQRIFKTIICNNSRGLFRFLFLTLFGIPNQPHYSTSYYIFLHVFRIHLRTKAVAKKRKKFSNLGFRRQKSAMYSRLKHHLIEVITEHMLCYETLEPAETVHQFDRVCRSLIRIVM